MPQLRFILINSEYYWAESISLTFRVQEFRTQQRTWELETGLLNQLQGKCNPIYPLPEGCWPLAVSIVTCLAHAQCHTDTSCNKFNGWIQWGRLTRGQWRLSDINRFFFLFWTQIQKEESKQIWLKMQFICAKCLIAPSIAPSVIGMPSPRHDLKPI